jgi:flagellar biosynthesis GTPase FlhF
MKLHTFTASDITAAMQEVEALLGKDAVIVSSNQDGDNVSVIAAIDRDFEPMPVVKPEIDQEKLQEKIGQILGPIERLKFYYEPE